MDITNQKASYKTIRQGLSFLILFSLSALLVIGQSSCFHAHAQPVTVAAQQWLEVQATSGTVIYDIGAGNHTAQPGVKLTAVGDRIQTLDNSTARLAIDTGAGFINLSENTTVAIQSFQVSPQGGRLTRLQVPEGQVRLEIRPFTNPDSSLEIETPAGWSGVRGTEFGIAVRPDGTTSVATLEGGVETSAQGQNVMINGGFQSLVIQGEPPTPAMPLTDNPWFDLGLLMVNGNAVHISGHIDPVNLLLIENIAQSVDRDGYFDAYLPVPETPQLTAVVITPLGNRQVYELGLLDT